MHIIKIKTTDLIEELEEALTTSGSTSWDLYVNCEGEISTRHNTYNNVGWFEILDMSGCVYEDQNGLYPDDDGYDYKKVAYWIADEVDIIPTDIEYWDEKDRNLKTAAIELV